MSVLRVLWKRKAGIVRDISEGLKKEGVVWAYTTVQTLLNRLESKGYVTRETTGPAHTYRAAISREKLVALRLNDLADQLCEGTATPLVMALMDNARFSQDDIARFRELLDQLDNPGANEEPSDAKE
jgi:predicted transcriptional regulator